MVWITGITGGNRTNPLQCLTDHLKSVRQTKNKQTVDNLSKKALFCLSVSPENAQRMAPYFFNPSDVSSYDLNLEGRGNFYRPVIYAKSKENKENPTIYGPDMRQIERAHGRVVLSTNTPQERLDLLKAWYQLMAENLTVIYYDNKFIFPKEPTLFSDYYKQQYNDIVKNLELDDLSSFQAHTRDG